MSENLACSANDIAWRGSSNFRISPPFWIWYLCRVGVKDEGRGEEEGKENCPTPPHKEAAHSAPTFYQ